MLTINITSGRLNDRNGNDITALTPLTYSPEKSLTSISLPRTYETEIDSITPILKDKTNKLKKIVFEFTTKLFSFKDFVRDFKIQKKIHGDSNEFKNSKIVNQVLELKLDLIEIKEEYDELILTIPNTVDDKELNEQLLNIKNEFKEGQQSFLKIIPNYFKTI